MSPILGIWASAQQSAAATSYDSLQTVTVGAGGSSSISFTSIPSTYTHLQIRGLGRSNTGSAGAQVVQLQFNGDTGANYNQHKVDGNGSSASATAGTSTSNIHTLTVPQGETSGAFGVGVIDILDYANTNKFKTIRCLFGSDTNATFVYVGLRSGAWRSTSAVNSITLTLSSFSFEQYSSFALYGIK